MREVELKLQVSEAGRAGVERAVAVPGVQRTRLQAIYFDTPDGRLAAAGLALRLRKEGRRWVQTLKAGSAHHLVRGEHNVALAAAPGADTVPDPARHHGTPPGEALMAALATRKTDADDGTPALQVRYRTDVWRRHRRQRTRQGTVELAFDEGEIVATAPDGVARRWPVCELEVELVSGSPRAVVEVARRWTAEHGLWLDLRSKSERGERLARGMGPHDAVPAAKARPVVLAGARRLALSGASRRAGAAPAEPEEARVTPAQAWAAVLANVLAHALPNWSEVAGGRREGEAVHQLRVALRRLRSAHRFFDGWPGVPPAPWAEGVAKLFAALGTQRDRDVLGSGLQREIDAALAGQGERALPLPDAPGASAWDERGRAEQGLVLIELCSELAGGLPGELPAKLPAESRAERPAEPPGGPAASEEGPSLRPLAAARLQQWHAQVRRDAKRFDRLDDEQRHRLRKRLKRLRYAIEFSADLFARRGVRRYLKRLRRAQERLGEFNDVVVATAAYRSLAEQEPRAWFALGWLAARRAAVLAAAADDLGRLRKAKPFWD